MQLRTKHGKVNLSRGQKVLLIDEQGFKKTAVVTDILENMQTIIFDNGEVVKTFNELESIIVEVVQVAKQAKSLFEKIRDFFKGLL